MISPRIIRKGADQFTPTYMPLVEREKIAPMHGSEFEGAGAVRWIVASAIVGVILCTKLIVGLLS